MKDVLIYRHKTNGKATLGALMVLDEGTLIFHSHLLERGWLNNKPNISCVLAGIYDLALEYSDKFKRKLWEAKGIPGRFECKFHAASFWKDLEGCFSPGEAPFDMNYDGEKDMVNSAKMLEIFMNAMGSDTIARLIIIDNFN